MKKILLFSALACMAFSACKKDSTPETAPVKEETVKTIDPIALSAGVKIGYGATNVKGAIPTVSTDANAPVLDTLYNDRPYDAISNRYVVIYPRVKSGYLAGYYLKINGADSYFKIDYKTGYGLRKAHQKNVFGLRDDNGDNKDSSIVIRLPDHLIGDTFSISYAAYDTLNRVSNTIRAIVTVIASKDSTDDSKLLGTWQINSIKSGSDGEWQTAPDADSADFNYYTCVENKLQLADEETSIYLPTHIITGGSMITFAPKNLVTSGSAYTETQLNTATSTCSNYIYDISDTGGSQNPNIGYSYDAAAKTITMINDADGTGSYITTQRLMVKEFTATKLVLYTVGTDTYAYDEISDIAYIELIKK
jgi:hypothetical protein